MAIQYDEKHEFLDYDKEVEKFKEITGYSVPDEYLAFLKSSGTGLFPQPGFYNNLMEVGAFYSFCIDETSDDEHNIYHANKVLQSDKRLSGNILAFAETSDCHNMFCVVLDGELRGAVLLLGDDNLLLTEGYKRSDIDEKEDLLDQSFSSFIDKLA